MIGVAARLAIRQLGETWKFFVPRLMPNLIFFPLFFIVVFPPMGVAVPLIVMAASGPRCAGANVPLAIASASAPLITWVVISGVIDRRSEVEVAERKFERLRWPAFVVGYWVIPLAVLLLARGANSVLRSRGIAC